MKRSIVIFVLFAISNLAFAQQKIIFEKILDTNYYPVIEKYSLPRSVTCTFKDGTKQRLVLEKVKGDSLVFRKYYNQPQNFDCLYSSLQKIKIHKRGEVALYVLSAGLAVGVMILVPVSYIFVTKDAGGPSLNMAYTTTIPLSIICTISVLLTTTEFPKKYHPNKWKLYAK